ncbi:MAG: hypothetical protein GF399_03675 [Candidatus Coatesbacteria bacterium]|nr:hypothetical protein [Candidatus Coatesbacteria bacterium]
MKRTVALLLVLALGSLVFAAAGISIHSTNPPAGSGNLGLEPQPLMDPQVIVTGSTMFLGAAWYYHYNNDDDGDDDYQDGEIYPANSEPLELVYNCMNYLIGESGSVACMGEFSPYSLSGLQTDYYIPRYDQNYMEFLEENLNGTNPNMPSPPFSCSYDFVQVTNSDPLTGGGTPYYDLLMIGEEWALYPTNFLHERAELTAYVAAGGRIIIAGSTKSDPVTGQQLIFLPKDQIWMYASTGPFNLPPVRPGHPVAQGIDREEWDIQNEIYAHVDNWDQQYYVVVFEDDDGYPTLLVGDLDAQDVAPTSWGALKASVSQ